MDHSTTFTLLACLIGLLLTWGVGANDLANIMSTTMGSKAVTIKQAVVIAIVFEFAGAFLGGSGVTTTLRSGIINTDILSSTPEILIYGMLSVGLAGTTWMLSASYFGFPVSITNAIVGSIVGFGTVVIGINAIHWREVSYIALSWLCSPAIASITAYALLVSIQRFIFGTYNPLQYAKWYLPVYLLMVGFVLACMTVLKGLNHSSLNVSTQFKYYAVLAATLIIAGSALFFIKRIPLDRAASRRERFDYIEKMFSVLMALTACAMVFAHGSNDVAIAVGPMSEVITLAKKDLLQNYNSLITYSMLFLGCIGVVAGLFMYGRKVIATVGSGITTLTPSRAFAATLAAATTVVASTSTGIPVSATQTLVGAILGVGLARGIGALNLNVIRNIFMSWIITIPAASLLTIIYFYLFKSLFTYLS
jgi:PiT family inorganic phosphate transporter